MKAWVQEMIVLAHSMVKAKGQPEETTDLQAHLDLHSEELRVLAMEVRNKAIRASRG